MRCAAAVYTAGIDWMCLVQILRYGTLDSADGVPRWSWLKSSALFVVLIGLISGGLVALSTQVPPKLRFVILGDRTGEAQPGVYEQVWRETAAEHPDFVINVGDTIQGGADENLNSEWAAEARLLAPFSRYRFFYTPGNHDVWDDASAAAYVKHTHHPLHYGFDAGPVHFSVLNNSETDDMPVGELDWLEQDLKAHPKTPVKFVFSHRPSWVMNAVLQNPDFQLQKMAKTYGVQYVVAGHIHEMLHFTLEGVTYLSMASSGGHLRNSKRYEDGWFFQHTLVTVDDAKNVKMEIKEVGPPLGKGRISRPEDWGAAGLLSH